MNLRRNLGVPAFALALSLAFAGNALAVPTVPLGTADPFAVVGGTAITNVPTSTISGSVGLSPAAGSFFTGLLCTEVTGGSVYKVDATGPVCATNDAGLLTTVTGAVRTAYLDAQGRLPTTTYVAADNQLGGLNLPPGIYAIPSATTANLIGNLTLTGDADAVWIFQASSDLVAETNSTITLAGGAQACNVFWQVSTAATLKTSASFVGTILAHDSISLGATVTVQGRLLGGAQASGVGTVALNQDTITRPTTCTSVAAIAAAAAAAAAQAAANAAAAAQAAANQAAADAAAAAVVAAAKAADEAKAAADLAAKVAADAKAAAAVAAKAAAVKNAKAAKAAAAEAAADAKIATAAAKKAARLARIARVAAAQHNLARPARRHVGLTG